MKPRAEVSSVGRIKVVRRQARQGESTGSLARFSMWWCLGGSGVWGAGKCYKHRGVMVVLAD